MKAKNLKWIITELEDAEIQGDRTINVRKEFEGVQGIRRYLNFRVFCDEMIQKLRIG